MGQNEKSPDGLQPSGLYFFDCYVNKLRYLARNPSLLQIYQTLPAMSTCCAIFFIPLKILCFCHVSGCGSEVENLGFSPISRLVKARH